MLTINNLHIKQIHTPEHLIGYPEHWHNLVSKSPVCTPFGSMNNVPIILSPPSHPSTEIIKKNSILK